MVNVGLFGELESWFSMIKVIAIVALIVTGAVMIVLQTKVKGGTISLTNLVSHGGFFPTRIFGFLLSFQMVVFTFVGVEIVGQTASETADPHKDIPMNALMTSSTILFVVVILNYVMPARIFDVVSTVSTICFVIVWIMIMAAHVVYRRQNKDNLGEFRMPGYPLTSWLTIAFYVAILILLFFIESTKLALIISIIFIVILAISYSFIKKNESIS